MTNPTNPQLSLFDRESAWEQQTKREPMPPPPSPGPPPVTKTAEQKLDTEELLRLLNRALDAVDDNKPGEAEGPIIDAINLIEDRHV